MNRRDLLKWTGGLAAATALATAGRTAKRAFGGPRAIGDRNRLLLVFAQGGWDTSYALDPKAPPDVDVPSGAARLFGNLDIFVDDTARPNVTEFFTRYAAHTAVIRGIATASVAHAECAKRIATGTRDETNPDMGAIVAHDNGNALPMPYLILGDTAYTGPYAVSAGRVGATNQIIALLDDDARYDTGGTGFATNDDERGLVARYAGASADRARAVRGANGYNRKRVDDFVEAIDRAERLRGVRDGFGNRGRTLAFADQIELALQALQTGISQTVMMNTRVSWDTHDNNDLDQTENHEETFASLTLLLEQLETLPGVETGKKMIDDTTVVVISELSRTPQLNSNLGKDHWPVTSAMAIGAGVAGGKAYGATNAKMEAEQVDFTSGAVSGTGKTLMTSNFVAGALAACGVDPATHLPGVEVFDAFVA